MNTIKLNKNKASFYQCCKMVKTLNNKAENINIPIQLYIYDVTSNIKKDLKVYKLNVLHTKKYTIKTKGYFNLNQLHNYLF